MFIWSIVYDSLIFTSTQKNFFKIFIGILKHALLNFGRNGKECFLSTTWKVSTHGERVIIRKGEEALILQKLNERMFWELMKHFSLLFSCDSIFFFAFMIHCIYYVLHFIIYFFFYKFVSYSFFMGIIVYTFCIS